jgi:hypothetical protein
MLMREVWTWGTMEVVASLVTTAANSQVRGCRKEGWRKGYELIWVRSDWTEAFMDETELTMVVIIVVSFLVRPETTPPTTGTESTVFVTSGTTFARAGRLSTARGDFLVRDEVRPPTSGTESTVFSTVVPTLLTTGRPPTGRVFLVSNEVRPLTTGIESTALLTSDGTFPTTGRSPSTGSVRFATDESVPVILDGMDKTSPFTPLMVDTTSMSRFPNGMARAEEPKVRAVKVVLNFMVTTGKMLQKNYAEFEKRAFVRMNATV